jgi:DNA invertase Pin-like site-specific DNA recombinase
MESAKLRLDQPIRTSKRKKEARSPQQQRDMAAMCAKLNGYEIVKVHDSGRNESGKTMDRASLNAIMERIRAGLTDGVIVALTDRLGRAPIEEAMTWINELHAAGGALVLADAGGRPVDLGDPAVKSNLVFQLQIARQFWEVSAKRMRQTRVGAVKAGKFVGPTPLGYAREDGRLVEHDVYGPVMRECFVIAARDGLHSAIRHMQRHVPERTWNTSELRRVLKSEVYLGVSASGTEIEPNLKAHVALTTKRIWTAAQTDPQHRRANGDYPASHLVHCGRCGLGLVGALQSVRERSYRRYRCSGKECRGGTSISAEKLEGHLRAVLAVVLASEDFRDQFSPDGLADAEIARNAAKADLDGLTDVVPPSHPSFAEWFERYNAAFIRAEAAYLALATKADQHDLLPAADELHKPEQFLRALRALARVQRVVVAPGRGAVADRVRVLDQRDHVSGPLAA